MLFMVIERFRDLPAVGHRFRTQGRLMPDTIRYVTSWMAADGSCCFQIMEAPARPALDPWLNAWSDLVDFDVTEIQTSADFWAARNPAH